MHRSCSFKFLQSPRSRVRSEAPGVGNAGLRRPSPPYSWPQPARRRRPGRGLARLAGCEAFPSSSLRVFAGFPRFPKGIRERLRSRWAPSRSETLEIFSVCLLRSGVSAGRVPAELGPHTRGAARYCGHHGSARCLSQGSVRCRARYIVRPAACENDPFSGERAFSGTWRVRVSGCRFLRQERR